MKNNTLMGDKNILFIAFLNKKHTLFKHEQQETHLDTKNEKTNALSWIYHILGEHANYYTTFLRSH